MLGTYALALAAADAVGSLARTLDETRIEVLGSPVVRIAAQGVDGPEDIRDADAHWTAVAAVSACRASDLRYRKDVARCFFDQLELVVCQRLEVRESLNVVCHLILVRHAGEDRHYPGLGADETEGPGCYRLVGITRLELLLDSRGHICEHAAADGLHDDYRYPSVAEDLVEFLASYDRVGPVEEVKLDLYEFHFRVIVEDLDEEFG